MSESQSNTLSYAIASLEAISGLVQTLAPVAAMIPGAGAIAGAAAGVASVAAFGLGQAEKLRAMQADNREPTAEERAELDRVIADLRAELHSGRATPDAPGT